MLPVSFGAMLMESLLGVIALITVGYLATKGNVPTNMTQPQVFANAIAIFLTKLAIPEDVSRTLITLAISAFALTSLDSVARVGRLAFQEFFIDGSKTENEYNVVEKICTNKYFATGITLVLAYILARVGYANIWPLFGSANQLLSALALIACAVFFKSTKRQGWMLWVPMIVMLLVTLVALTLTIVSRAQLLISLKSTNIIGDGLQLTFAVALFALGITVAFQGIKKMLKKETV